MSKSITIKTRTLLNLVDTMLRNEEGVDNPTYVKIYELFVYSGHLDLWRGCCKNVDATDGRFYLSEDAPNLLDLLGD